MVRHIAPALSWPDLRTTTPRQAAKRPTDPEDWDDETEEDSSSGAGVSPAKGGTRSRASADEEDLVPPNERSHLLHVICPLHVILSEAKDLSMNCFPGLKVLRFAQDDPLACHSRGGRNEIGRRDLASVNRWGEPRPMGLSPAKAY